MRSHHTTLQRILFLLTLCLLILTACNRGEVEIPFEAIDDYDSTLYENTDPTLMLISTPQDISILAPYIPSIRRAEVLNDIDFKHYIVIGVFQGHKPGGPAGVTVESVTFRNASINIYVTFLESQGVTQPAEMSAYQIIQVEKPKQLAGKNATFTLIANGKRVAKKQIIFP